MLSPQKLILPPNIYIGPEQHLTRLFQSNFIKIFKNSLSQFVCTDDRKSCQMIALSDFCLQIFLATSFILHPKNWRCSAGL